MRRLFLIFAIFMAMFLMMLASLQSNAAQHKAKAEQYVSQGLYDEAMLAYHDANLHQVVFRKIIYLFGETNAFLSIFGTLFMISGLLLKKTFFQEKINRVRITREFNWR